MLGPVSSPLGVSDLSLRHAAGEGFLLGLSPDLGGVWLFLSPSPGGCRSGCVWARLRRVFCPRAGACFFSFRGFRLVTSPRCGGGFFARFEPGFRWCLAVLSPSPGGWRSGCVWARLRRVFCPRAGACFFSFPGRAVWHQYVAGVLPSAGAIYGPGATLARFGTFFFWPHSLYFHILTQVAIASLSQWSDSSSSECPLVGPVFDSTLRAVFPPFFGLEGSLLTLFFSFLLYLAKSSHIFPCFACT